MYDPATALHGTEAVFAAHPLNHACIALKELATDAKYDRAELTLTVDASNIVLATQAVKDAGYNFFEDATALDFYPSEPRFQITYHILSHAMKQRVRIVAKLPGETAPRSTPSPPSGLRPTSTSARFSTSSASTSADTRTSPAS